MEAFRCRLNRFLLVKTVSKSDQPQLNENIEDLGVILLINMDWISFLKTSLCETVRMKCYHEEEISSAILPLRVLQYKIKVSFPAQLKEESEPADRLLAGEAGDVQGQLGRGEVVSGPHPELVQREELRASPQLCIVRQ